MLARLAVSETSVLKASGGAVPDPALTSFSILNESRAYCRQSAIHPPSNSREEESWGVVTSQWTAASYHWRSSSLHRNCLPYSLLLYSLVPSINRDIAICLHSLERRKAAARAKALLRN